MSNKFNLVKGYYDDGLWSENQVKNAVVKNWITEAEFETITGIPYQ
jgi:hypothetical protein